MPHRLEVALRSDLFDAEGDGIRQKAQNYFDIHLEDIRTIHVLTIDAELSESQLNSLKEEIFTNPVIQISSFKPLPIEFDWSIWGLKTF
jgi:phosphoribosylformylglycinamidine synthase